MFTVYFASHEDMHAPFATVIKEMPDAILNGSTHDLSIALEECTIDKPGVLVIDDNLLKENDTLFEQIALVPYPVVVIASAEDPHATHRALSICAKDFIDRAHWPETLAPTLARVAIPIQGEIHHEGKVLTIFSSKGGVGKSTLSVNLAIALAKASHNPVALVDLDVQFGDLAPMTGTSPLTTLHDVIKDSTPIHAAELKTALKRIATNVYLLAAPKNPEDADDIQAPHIVQILQILRKTYAYVLVDTAPGYSDLNNAACDFCDTILAVCTPDVVMLQSMGQTLANFYDAFHYSHDKIKLVLNRSGSKTGIDPEDLVQILHTPLAYQLPSNGALPVHAANTGIPLLLQVPDSALSKAIQNMANALVKETEGHQRTANKKSFMKKSLLSKVLKHFSSS